MCCTHKAVEQSQNSRAAAYTPLPSDCPNLDCPTSNALCREQNIPKIDFETRGELPTRSQTSENTPKINFMAFIKKGAVYH